MRISKKYLSCYIEGPEEEVDAIMRVISAVQNTYNTSYWDAIARLFRAGAMAMSEDVKSEQEREKVRRGLLKQRLIEVVKEESREDTELRKGMVELGVERIVSAARTAGMDESEVRNILEKVQADAPYSSLAAQWLDEFLGDYKSHSTDDIKEAAIESGVLPEKDDSSFESRWSTMRTVANRMGFSGGKWGEWQKRLL